MIQAQSLTKSYGKATGTVCAVRELGFAIDAGERAAIVGKSGSGKSTLLNLLAGLDRPTAGSLTVDGRRLDSMSRREMARYRLQTVGIVFQAFQLVPQRTALQNVELPLILAGRPEDERRGEAAAWLERVGLAERAGHFPYELSGGEQQRVAIARSLVNRPQVLLADEPTGNLDSSTASEVVALLEQLCQYSQLTFVLVTHDTELAGRLCPRRLTMIDGQLQE